MLDKLPRTILNLREKVVPVKTKKVDIHKVNSNFFYYVLPYLIYQTFHPIVQNVFDKIATTAMSSCL